VHVLLPFMVLSLLAALDRIDPLLLDAGHMLGSSRALIWRSVILPLALPALARGRRWCFSLAVSSYVTPAVLGPSGPNFITTLIYEDFISLYDWGGRGAGDGACWRPRAWPFSAGRPGCRAGCGAPGMVA
jgi:putative spermidine/putrescine transport system permease protein